MFLCGRTPEHAKNQHFLIPDLAEQIPENIKKFRKLLQNSSGIQLERLIQDVYDEIDRREINVQWMAAEQFRMPNQHIAPNHRLSATRNQLRQKLAKFDARDFSQLIIDLLKEIRRRYFCHPLPDDDRVTEFTIALNQSASRISNLDNSRDYDEVASDKLNRKSRGISSSNKLDIEAENDPLIMNPSVALDNYLELKEKFSETMEKLNNVVDTNLQIEFQSMKKTMESIQNEQTELWREIKFINQNNGDYSLAQNTTRRITSPITIRSPPANNSLNAPDIGAIVMPTSLLHKQSIGKKTLSINNFADNIRSISHPSTINRITTSNRQNNSTSPPQTAKTSYDSYQMSNNNRNSHSYFNPEYYPSPNEIIRNGSAPPQHNGDDEILADSINNSTGIKTLFNDEDNLIIETELLTGAIKNLLSDLQLSGPNESNATFHADSVCYIFRNIFFKISHHISRIVRVIPSLSMVGKVHSCVSDMESAMTELSKRCLQRPLNSDETCNAACDLAKAAKQLLVTVHNRNDFF